MSAWRFLLQRQVSLLHFSLDNHSSRTATASDSSKFYSTSVTEALLTSHEQQILSQGPTVKENQYSVNSSSVYHCLSSGAYLPYSRFH